MSRWVAENSPVLRIEARDTRWASLAYAAIRCSVAMRRDTTRWQRKLVAVSQAKSRVRSTRNRKLWMCDMREYENHRRFVDFVVVACCAFWLPLRLSSSSSAVAAAEAAAATKNSSPSRSQHELLVQIPYSRFALRSECSLFRARYSCVRMSLRSQFLFRGRGRPSTQDRDGYTWIHFAIVCSSGLQSQQHTNSSLCFSSLCCCRGDLHLWRAHYNRVFYRQPHFWTIWTEKKSQNAIIAWNAPCGRAVQIDRWRLAGGNFFFVAQLLLFKKKKNKKIQTICITLSREWRQLRLN